MTASRTTGPVIPGLASPYRRLAARLIDFVVAMFVLIPASFLFIGAWGVFTRGSATSDAVNGIIDFSIMILVLLAYETCMTHLLGWTLGKRAMGMKIVDVNGEKLGWGMALLRAFLFGISAFLVMLGIVITASILGWVLFAGLGRYQRFPHEQATRSYVMRCVQQGGVEVKVSPYSDLDQLRSSGMISEEEYQRKKKELGI